MTRGICEQRGMRAWLCSAALLVACAPEVRPTAPVPEVFPATLAGVSRSLLFDGRFQGDLTSLPFELKRPLPIDCVPQTFTVAVYGDVVLGHITFASEQALDTCLLAIPDRPMTAVLRMVRAAKFAWFTRRQIGVGLVGERIVGTFHKNGIVDNARTITEAWHRSLGLLDQRHDLDLDMLTGP